MDDDDNINCTIRYGLFTSFAQAASVKRAVRHGWSVEGRHTHCFSLIRRISHRGCVQLLISWNGHVDVVP